MKKIVDKIKEIGQMKNGKAILFFAFYLVFFVIVIVFLRFGTKSSLPRQNEYERGNPSLNVRFDNILKNNYAFTYEINLDGVSYVYVGEKYDNQEMFKFNGMNYYSDLNGFYISNGVWSKVQSPYIFSEFLDVNNIGDIISASTYQSKTSYESGREAYSYLISSNTINKLIHSIDSDFLEDPNEIVVGMDDNKNISDVTFKFNSYCSVNKLCNGDLSIKLKYDKIGEVVKIENPIVQ